MRLQLGVWCRFWLGLAFGLVALCVAIEIVRAIYNHGWEHAFFAVVEYIGRFTWLHNYQSLLTGVAAVAAAAFSVRAVRDQIRKSDEASSRQIAHEQRLETGRVEAKRIAARSMLSLSLTNLCEYSNKSAEQLHSLLQQCKNERLPKSVKLPELVGIPSDDLVIVKEMIEYVEQVHRPIFAKLVSKIQVQAARVRGLRRDHRVNTVGLHESDLIGRVVDALEVYALASALFPYARYEPGAVPKGPVQGEIVGAIDNISLYSSYTAEITSAARRLEEVLRLPIETDRSWSPF